MKLDKSKPYGETIGSTDGSKYDQNGIIFDRDGNQLNAPLEIKEVLDNNHDEPKKRGRPFKQ